MSHQTSIDKYFKSKLPSKSFSSMNQNSAGSKKRFSLSLANGPPVKTLKNEYTNSIVNICPKAETSSRFPSPERENCKTETLIDSIKSEISPTTPRKSPKSFGSQGSGSKDKFYSPNKKRAVLKKRSPVKKNLARDSFGCLENDNSIDHVFKAASDGMDDKTIFLLNIIYNFLNNENLKNLLDECSQTLLSRCLHVKKPGVRVICRLYWRQATIYRWDDLENISNDRSNKIQKQIVQEMISDLVKNGFLENVNSDDTCKLNFHEITSKLKADELKQICKELNIKVQSKQSAIKLLENYSNQSSISKFFIQAKENPTNNKTRLLEIFKKKLGSCYKLTEKARSTLYELYLLTYLGMGYSIIREKRLELTLLYEKINRETFPIIENRDIDDASVVFKNRKEFEKYLDAHYIYEKYIIETDDKVKCILVETVYEMYKKIDKEDMIRYTSLPEWLRRYTPPYIFVKILGEGIQSLKRNKSDVSSNFAVEILSVLIAQDSFRQHKKAGWYTEKALILQKYLGRHDEAAQLLLEGLQSNKLSDDAKDAMRPQAVKISKQKTNVGNKLRIILNEIANENIKLEKDLSAEHLHKNPMDNWYKGKLKYEVCIDGIRQAIEVEDYCIWHYINNGTYTHGDHWEGRIITTIFFLLFWDIIYSKPAHAPGIFLSRYQRYPLDLYCDSFYTNRKSEIDERLSSLAAGSAEDMLEAMRRVWDSRPEGELSGLTRSIEWDRIEMVAGCLGPRRVGALCERLATNYGHAHSGFPDLTLWNAHTKTITFMEVKSDSDRPSVKQLQWMHYLQQRGLRTAFCYVGGDSGRRARLDRP
ncbi:fanconi-associated nuclease 1 [Bombyx mori]|uniref:Fanconi-associated nuclease n=1 Tax=Bombyx mori TaxID=7091 RepID=A0A8R2AN17_BOMMO|nr:fanconi-associated nuclease 1 [Bombyx mori]